jgi:hypothetical protein
MVGSTAALAALCRGERKMTVVDLVVEKPPDEEQAEFTDSTTAQNAPLNVVHVRLIEEYARLQQPNLWHRKTRQIDLHA